MSLDAVFASQEYIDEFSLNNEISYYEESWDYLDNNGIYRKIDIYRYCSNVNSNCILVAFDVSNKVDLSLNLSSDFFESFVLKKYVVEGKITEDIYTIPNLSKSVTCNYIIPEFYSDAQIIAEEKVAPNLLPKNARKSYIQFLNIRKGVGVVKDANPYVLVIGASCIGSNAAEFVCASTLNSCKAIIVNLRNNKAFEGQADDLISCSEQAIEKLNLLKHSPDNLFNYGETETFNFIRWVFDICQNTLCNIKSFGTGNCSYDAVYDLSNIDQIENFVKELEMNTPIIDISDSANLAIQSSARISLKAQQVSDKKKQLTTRISKLDSNIDSKSKSDFKDILFKYDFRKTKDTKKLAEDYLLDAKNLSSEFKFNSALKSLNQSEHYIIQAEDLFNQSINDGKVFSYYPLIVVFVLFILILLFMK